MSSHSGMLGKALSRSGDLATMEVQAKPILPTTEKDPSDLDLQPRVYKRRWMIVFLFAFYSLSNAYQWIHLNIIGDVILKYYNASMPEDQFQRETTLDWLSMVYMLAYIPLIFPATWLLNKKGLRVVAICGCFLNALGAWLKVACVSPDRFPVLMFAQTICAIAQIFILGLPARLAAVWFGPNEVSTATSIGVFGNQVGCAVGFLLPPVLVPYSEDLNQIGKDIGTMFYMGAGVTTFFFIMVILIFKNAPPMPPSKAQMLSVQNESNEHYGESLIRLVKNRGFILLTLTYGINTGSYYAISTLLNPIVLYYFEGHQKDAGQIGLTIVLAGVVGSIVAGVWLDRTKTFKGTTVGIYFLSMAGMIAFTFTLKLDILWVVYLCAGALGFFMTGYLPVGFEFAAEITYPESEGTSSGLLNASAQTFGIILTIGMRAMLNNISILSANITICVALLIGTVITAFIGANYKRQEAGREMLAKIDQLEYNVEVNEKSQMADQPI
ncbi:FLVCR [Mytilus coruscus]|uniref:Choline/ethanolamine transporter FLVCR1 n=1 Tax=Mytilus coruscus TaxID=42192 RepID=A0A6J8BAX0_MYTCO|nr:FLVCR [Mytilus coruscus]